MKYLGIDYGTRRVGIAMSDDGGSIAFPETILKNDNTLYDKVMDIIDERDIDEVVVGHSTDEEGNDNPVMDHINDFVAELSILIPLPIHFENEAFTSMEARRTPEVQKNKKERASRVRKSVKSADYVDDSAAALMLQRFLDKQE